MRMPTTFYCVMPAVHHVQRGRWQKTCFLRSRETTRNQKLEQSLPTRAEHHAGASFLASAAALLGIAAPTVGGSGAAAMSLTASSAMPAVAPLQEPDPEAAHKTLPVGKSARHHGVRFGDDAEPGARTSGAHAAPAAALEAHTAVQATEGRRRGTQYLRTVVADATARRADFGRAGDAARARVGRAGRAQRARVCVCGALPAPGLYKKLEEEKRLLSSALCATSGV